MNHMAEFFPQVVVHQLKKAGGDGQTDTGTDKMEGGSADDSLEVGSGMELAARDDTFLDDEDYRQANGKILSQFVCGYLPGIAHVNLAHAPRVRLAGVFWVICIVELILYM